MPTYQLFIAIIISTKFSSRNNFRIFRNIFFVYDVLNIKGVKNNFTSLSYFSCVMKKKGFFGAILGLFASMSNSLKEITEPEIVPEIKFDEAVKYFVNERPDDPRIKKGAIMRKKHEKGQLIVQAFLDDNNKIISNPAGNQPYGREFIVQQLDEELSEAFEKKRMIIVDF